MKVPRDRSEQGSPRGTRDTDRPFIQCNFCSERASCTDFHALVSVCEVHLHMLNVAPNQETAMTNGTEHNIQPWHVCKHCSERFATGMQLGQHMFRAHRDKFAKRRLNKLRKAKGKKQLDHVTHSIHAHGVTVEIIVRRED